LNTEGLLARIGGVLMLGVFGINVYIGLYDTNLAQISPVHQQLNWVIAAADLIAALFLLVKPRSLIFKTLGGIIWPVLYIGSLFIDVETRLCLGAAASTCLPTVSDAYQYLILGSQAQEWVLWPYTIRLGIALAVLSLVLSLVSLYFRKPKVKENKMPPPPQNMPPQDGSQNMPPPK
jgi:hypothetical protein